ncbi:valine--tRNA ligase [Phaeobacter inhibens]|uniref:valine--tRNA ligase n=1 Tax=Phaeobacter inhibens TaxID=221822 RepID=UPI000C9BD489|nr:valine--tRNA ligase [Phaeobacter inhibens]AUQ62120.1 valyl-tRNA synthetase ValS [Phaeobacter inhibens]AUQ82094.1 valyl-tRNA synthetase ValS [Phaeobacter inhibens]AUQ89817.1 valyl-tRNA synthetase ValS [Phaeobacter inhibens]MDO6755421.1 valine--tRNA ligase [Phaeobacter inhibens]
MAMDKTFNAAEAEARLSKAWDDAGCFRAGANAKRSETYSVMIPPPNVTGVLHMGHAFNNTLQDILIRWKRMQGYDTLWQPGTDHAGIATQMVVERELAKTQQPSRAELGREKFLEKIWEWKEQSGGTIINQLKRLGASCDYDRTAFTMAGAQGDTRTGHENSPNFHDAVIKVFVEMYNKGLIYRGKRLVNWDPHFETAISDLEVENIEVAGHMWHFKYPLAGGATYTYVEKDEDGNVTLEEERDYISIATTRPETMLGDGAVAVHPSDERYAPIVGMLCEIPVGPKAQRRRIPIITDEYPDKDFGSGAVKITGAHDFNDYQVAKRAGIPMYNLMDTKANMRSDGAPYVEEATTAQAIANGEAEFTEASIAAMNLVPEEYRGLDRFEARKRVIADITAEGLAVMQTVTKTVKDEDGNETEVSEIVPYVENKPIMQPFGDRSKVVIEPMLTDQWFVDAASIVGPALDVVKDGTVKILPESGEKVYYHWLENIEPWCISRQLWWGHQIPVWFDTDGNQYCAESFEHAAELARQKHGADVEIRERSTGDEFTVEGQRKAPNPSKSQIGNPQVKMKTTSVTLERDPDVLDTWFSSGLWPIGTLGWPEWTEETSKYFPTSTLVTGQDILFFWVARMMMMQLAVLDQDLPVEQRIPFDTVYLHGLVRDAKGKKMSKSTGNVVDPLEIIDEYGADALRFTNAAMASLGGVLKLDMQRIAGYRNFGTKLWNAVNFAHFNNVYDPATPAYDIPDAKAAVNQWIIGETAKVRVEVDAALEAYRFNDAALGLYAFVWGKVCDWYIELSKPLFGSEDEAVIAETRQTLGWVLDQCMILLHPIMPFITEELWGNTAKRANMLVHENWPTYGTELVNADADAEMNWVITAIENIRSTRAQMHVPAGAKIPMVVTEFSDQARAAWEKNEAMIQKLARITTLEQVDTFPKGCASVAAPGASFGLPLADVIDVDAEKARLEKTLGKLAKELGGLRGRLNNPKFAASAPEEVVAEARENLRLREEEEAKIKEALARLAEIG